MGRCCCSATAIMGLACLSLSSVWGDLIIDGPELPNEPPAGDYKLVQTGPELSKNLLAELPALKYIRIATSVFVAEGDVVAAAPFTTAYVDCDGNTLDFQQTTAFTVNKSTRLEFFDCTIYASGSEEAWAYRTVFHNTKMIHPCQGSSSAVKGLAAGNRLQPISFDKLPVTIPPDRQTLFLNGTFICLEMAATPPNADDTPKETGGVATITATDRGISSQPSQGSNASTNSDGDTNSGAREMSEHESPSVPAAAIIGVCVAVAVVLMLAIAAITARTCRRRLGSGQERWQERLQEISVSDKQAKISLHTSCNCEPSLVQTRNSLTSLETVCSRSAGAPSNGNCSGNSLASGLQVGPHAQVDIRSRLSKHKLRSIEASRATALPNIAAQDLEVLDLVGAGGYGHVYRGYWKGHEVAVKTILFQDTGGSERGKLDRACKEAAIARKLCHPSIVCTYTHQLQQMKSSLKGELVDFKLYLIQEFCLGGTLSSLIRERFLHTAEGGVNLNRVLTILLQVASGAKYMHDQGLMHADLNPRNVLLQLDESICQQGQTRFDRTKAWQPMAEEAAAALDEVVPKSTAKLADFGLSVQPDEQASHVSNVRHGTPFYSAPEVRKDNKLRFTSDVYSFGVIMWEIFSGVPPFIHKGGRLMKHPRMGHLPVAAPLNYAMLMRACLLHDPNSRPEFAQILEVLNDLKGEIAVGHYMAADESIHAVEKMETQQWRTTDKLS